MKASFMASHKINVTTLRLFLVFLFFAGSKSQSALWNAITAGMGIKGKEQKAPLNDPRSPEEILADDLPATDEPDATEKTAIRFAAVRLLQGLRKTEVNVYYLLIIME